MTTVLKETKFLLKTVQRQVKTYLVASLKCNLKYTVVLVKDVCRGAAEFVRGSYLIFVKVTLTCTCDFTIFSSMSFLQNFREINFFTAIVSPPSFCIDFTKYLKNIS